MSDNSTIAFGPIGGEETPPSTPVRGELDVMGDGAVVEYGGIGGMMNGGDAIDGVLAEPSGDGTE